jgi:hypothetical protein
VLDQWNDIGRKLVAIAEDLPEDKYDYKPNPDSRTFVANLLHAAGPCISSPTPSTGQKGRYGDDPKRDELKTKAQVVAFVKKVRAGRRRPDQEQGRRWHGHSG